MKVRTVSLGSVVGVFAVPVLIIGIASWLALAYWQGLARTRAQSELGVIADLKTAEIANWRQERLNDARFFSQAPFVAWDIQRLRANPGAPEVRAEVLTWLQLLKGGDRYEQVVLFDQELRPLLVLPQDGSALPPQVMALAASVLRTNTVQFTDLHRCDNTNEIRMDLVFPVFGPGAAGTNAGARAPLGIILLRLDPHRFLYPLLWSWPSPQPSPSAETLLVRSEGDQVVYLNELRHQSDTALRLRLPLDAPDLPAARGARGFEGVCEGLDYRGVPVTAATRRISGTPWILVAKVDQSELYAPLRGQAWTVGLLGGALVLAALLGAALFWRQRSLRYVERQLARERERKTLSDRLALLMRQANDVILLLDDRWRVVEANERALQMYGYTIEELRRLSLRELRAPGARAAFDEMIGRVNLEQGLTLDTEHQRRDGSCFPVESSIRAMEMDGRRYYQTIARDISQRRAHEAEIERLNRLYAALSQVNQAIVRVRNREELFAEVCRVLVEFGRFQLAWISRVNLETREIIPVAQHGDTGGYLQSIRVFADDRPEGQGPTGTATRENRPYVCNDFFADPRTLPWREAAAKQAFRASAAFPIRERDRVRGALTLYAKEPGFFGPAEVALLEEVTVDLSFALEHLEQERARRQAEDSLRESEARYRLLSENSGDVIWLFDLAANCYTYVSPSVQGLRGFTPEEIYRQSMAEALTPDSYQMVARLLPARLAAVQAGDESQRTLVHEVSQPRKDGSIVPTEVVTTLLTDAGKQVTQILGVTRDITERKRAEERLHQSEIRFLEVTDHLREWIWETAPDGLCTYSSAVVEKVLGYAPGDLVGRRRLSDLYPADRVAEAAATLEAIFAQRRPFDRLEADLVHRNGQRVKVEISGHPFFDEDAHLLGYRGAVIDVTEKKKLEAQFLRAQRIESVGALASGIAHDLNNILTPILMCAPLLNTDPPPEERQQLLATLESSARRAVEVVKQLLSFGRGNEGEKTVLQPRHLLREMGRIARETFPRSIRIEEKVDPDLWPVRGNSTQIHQVLLNLCVNARDAMPDGGRLSLVAANVWLDAHYTSMHPEARPGPYVSFRLWDSGLGIASEVRDKIFDPFFTTKQPGKGTGLGLTTVLGIVKDHGGFVRLTSVPGQGTEFEFFLPAVPDTDLHATPPDAATAIPRANGECILVVDDEPAIRESAGRALRQHGYEVIEAADGIEALALYASRRADIRAVVTDMMMPLMDGLALTRGLRKLDPRVPILVSTGTSFDTDFGPNRKALLDLGVNRILVKPHNAEVLLRALHEILAPPGADS